MKRIIFPIFALITLAVVTACSSDNDIWGEYANWRELNNEWFSGQQELRGTGGQPFYTTLNPSWYPTAGVLIHYYNDRSKTVGNLSPLLTSTVRVKYKGMFYNGEGFDSSYADTDSVRDFSLAGVVSGWQVGLMDMRVGDTCDIVLPYPMAYGSAGSGSIPPFSALKFSVKLVDIPAYQVP